MVPADKECLGVHTQKKQEGRQRETAQRMGINAEQTGVHTQRSQANTQVRLALKATGPRRLGGVCWVWMHYLSVIPLHEGYGCWADHVVLHFLGVRAALTSIDILTPPTHPIRTSPHLNSLPHALHKHLSLLQVPCWELELAWVGFHYAWAESRVKARARYTPGPSLFQP